MIDPQHWLVEESRYVYDRRPYMVLREDSVRLPNGARIPDYFVFEYPEWVSVLAVTLTVAYLPSALPIDRPTRREPGTPVFVVVSSTFRFGMS